MFEKWLRRGIWPAVVVLAPVAVVGLMAAGGAGAGVPTARRLLFVAAGPPGKPVVEVRVDQVLGFEPATFKVTITSPGWRGTAEPRVRPFYGRATLIPDSLTASGFTFRWDVAGAIRAARGELRSTKIYVHWTMASGAAAEAEGTDMLTVLSVLLGTDGRVAVSDVTTSPPASEPVIEPVATRPAPPGDAGPAPTGPEGPLTSAVCRLRTDPGGTVLFQVWVVGQVTLVDRPRAMANIGSARAVVADDALNRINIEWTRPERERRQVIPVGLVVTWTALGSRDTYLSGRTVVDLLVGPAGVVGVAGVQTNANLMPRPVGSATRPSGHL